jgi:hypothetical protein
MTQPDSTDTDDTFDAITERLLGEPDVDEGRIFNPPDCGRTARSS